MSNRHVMAVGMGLAIATGSVVVGHQPLALAQVDSSCYMVTSSGRVVKLDKLCQGGSSTKVAPTNVFRVPIKYRRGRTPIIEVRFNGRQTFEMLLDTGASQTLITRNMANALGTPVVGSRSFTIADGSVVQLPIGKVQSMSVSGAEIRDVEVAIAERIGVGLLGQDFLNSYDVQIKQNIVEFYRR
jgi:aspartyl protease family protein